ncbi:hypothetical protein V8G54_018654 [Vigna mungo]|uniref:Uncharacterized protein n=1 Tax=Vigna mungo TaxID=3915 RepID=A0AAQ3NB62_VIGMU
MMISGLLCNNHIHWITFHGAYDFAYLVKVLSHRFLHVQPLLPPNLGNFLQLVKFFFGHEIYDVKHLVKFCPNLYGGLDRVSKSLGLDNSARKIHQAGGDRAAMTVMVCSNDEWKKFDGYREQLPDSKIDPES